MRLTGSNLFLLASCMIAAVLSACSHPNHVPYSNAPPEIVLDADLSKMMPGETRKFSIDIIDNDDDCFGISWFVNGELRAKDSYVFEFRPMPSEERTYTIKVTAEDFEAEDEASAEVTVLSDILWETSFGGSGQGGHGGMVKTSDGGVIFAGWSESDGIPGVVNHGGADCYVVKIDHTGTIEWQKLLGGSGNDKAVSICRTVDNKYIIAAETSSTDIQELVVSGPSDVYLIKLDSSGTVDWQMTYDVANISSTSAVAADSDGGFVVAAQSTEPGNNGGVDAVIVKFDTYGAEEWRKNVGGGDSDYANHVLALSTGGYLLLGSSRSADILNRPSHGSADAFAAKLDNEGQLVWQQLYGGIDEDSAEFGLERTSGEYLIAGECYLDGSYGYLLQLHDDGDISQEVLFEDVHCPLKFIVGYGNEGYLAIACGDIVLLDSNSTCVWRRILPYRNFFAIVPDEVGSYFASGVTTGISDEKDLVIAKFRYRASKINDG